MHIYLTGFMAAGKSTTGERLAERLGWPFVDLDREIERAAGMSVAGIFVQGGEEDFREREHQALAALPPGRSAVVATGGGIVNSERNRELMRERGVTVWLDVPFDRLMDRLSRDPAGRRPLYRDRDQVRELLERRRRAYESAEFRMAVEDLSADEVVEAILDLLEERLCAI